jgi:hypothetical protein
VSLRIGVALTLTADELQVSVTPDFPTVAMPVEPGEPFPPPALVPWPDVGPPMTPEQPINPAAKANAVSERKRVTMEIELPDWLASMSLEPFFTLFAGP